jgi:ribbon-helix-helix CopG family protein
MATTKTTLYLPAALKRRIEDEAQRRGLSEAEVIRRVLDTGLDRPRPRGALFSVGPITHRLDEAMKGFGER